MKRTMMVVMMVAVVAGIGSTQLAQRNPPLSIDGLVDADTVRVTFESDYTYKLNGKEHEAKEGDTAEMPIYGIDAPDLDQEYGKKALEVGERIIGDSMGVDEILNMGQMPGLVIDVGPAVNPVGNWETTYDIALITSGYAYSAVQGGRSALSGVVRKGVGMWEDPDYEFPDEDEYY